MNLELLMRESKRHLFESGSFAPTWHEFYLRDMEEAMGPSWLARPAPGFDRARYLFFPGCQSLESDPDAMAAVYGYLRKHYPSTAILMACCGVPALYAGNIKAMEDVHRRILTAWEQLGKPVALLACPTCAKTFAEFLPDIPWKSIYEVIVKNGLPEDSRPREAFAAKRWALFDPCASRNFPDMQEAVRDLCLSMGMSCAELPESRERALCCGMGGHIYPANPSLSDRMVKAAADQSNLPYLTFCSNCRNQFLFAGKETIHVLDAVFGIAPQKQSLHLLERKENRRLLKKQWLADGRDEQGLAPEAERMKKKAAFKLHFDESLLRKMDRLLISVEDVYETVSFAETQKLSIVNEETGMNIAHRRLGYITYWVIYRRAGIKIDVINVYSHRIRVLEPLDTLETGRA